jgi:proteic killer suppression protein
MDIIFADKKLKKYANHNGLARQKLGAQRAKAFQKRMEDIRDADSFADFEHLPGNYHQLKGNRKDQWSCDLDQPYRLIFMPAADPIPKDNDGKQVLTDIRAIIILEINNYHKEG